MDNFDSFRIGAFGGVLIGIGITLGLPYYHGENTFNNIPRSPARLEKGFIDPKDIMIILKDVDESQETVFRYKTEDFHLKFDKNDLPYFHSYSVSPAQPPKIVPGNYDSRGLESSVNKK